MNTISHSSSFMTDLNRGEPERRHPSYFLFKRLFKKPTFDHEADQDACSTSNMEFSRNFRCSQKFHYAPLLISQLHPIFSVLKTGLFELAL
jgi:hypothetical protein